MHWPKCPFHMKNLIIFFGTVTFVINLFIYEAREYSLVPVGFLTAQFLQKGWWHLLMVEIWWCFSLLLSWRKEGVKRNDVDWSYHCFSFFKQALQRNTTSLLPSQQRLHKLHFLQKLGCQKPCWDQAKLSSKVNKQVGLWKEFQNKIVHQKTLKKAPDLLRYLVQDFKIS